MKNGIEFDGKDMFVIYHGVKIAKRGKNKTWVSLEPGFTVYTSPDYSELTIEKDGVIVTH